MLFMMVTFVTIYLLFQGQSAQAYFDFWLSLCTLYFLSITYDFVYVYNYGNRVDDCTNHKDNIFLLSSIYGVS